MRDPIRVLVLGTGQMGAGISRLVLEKQGLELVGAFARRAARAGVDLGCVLELERDLGLPIGTDLAVVIDKTRPDVAIQATCSTLNDAWPEISLLLARGVSVISIAEEMTYPACRSRTIAREMHSLAIQNKAAVLGTGINPGFVLDLLVIALTSAAKTYL